MESKANTTNLQSRTRERLDVMQNATGRITCKPGAYFPAEGYLRSGDKYQKFIRTHGDTVQSQEPTTVGDVFN